MSNALYREAGQFERCSGNPGVRAEEADRSVFRKDFGRLLHAPAFRRLQGKTQLFPGVESDFFRNRLTHSLEVAQIAKGIAANLNIDQVQAAFPGSKIDEDLVEFAAIAHDLGHPPFGHNGEYALDEIMREHGGFEGNAQTLRILAVVERKLVRFEDEAREPSSEFGLDLSYRSLASVLKYDKLIEPVRSRTAKLAKGYYKSEEPLVLEIKRRVAPNRRLKFKTIECAIMDIADDIAYSTYDLEDSLHAGFITPAALIQALANREVYQEVARKTNAALTLANYDRVGGVRDLVDVCAEVFDLKGSSDPGSRSRTKKSTAAELITFQEAFLANKQFVSDGVSRSRFTADRVGRLIHAVEFVPNLRTPQLSTVRINRGALLQVEVMKHLTYEIVIRSPRLAVTEYRGKEIVSKLFAALAGSRGTLLPDDWKQKYDEELKKGLSASLRVVCDFVAGMTDRYAVEIYGRLFGEGFTIFKPL